MTTKGRAMPLEYAVRIEPLAESDGGGYLATVPDLPGCSPTARRRKKP
jgi:predicted RNase H-like HicB family nuclease